MKQTALFLLSFALTLCLVGCSGSAQSMAEPPVEQAQVESNHAASEQGGNANHNASDSLAASTPIESVSNAQAESSAENAKKVLVAFFSRAGENYGVGVVEKGNTQIIADLIAEELGADTFEIARVTPYPESYRDCTDEAQAEKSASARPALTAAVDNFDEYNVIFLGYPIWWGDMPMPVYTFLESYDFSGKTVIPFCTHAGSGLAGTVQTLKDLTNATVLDGLAIAGTTAQNDPEQEVSEWLETLDINE